MFAKGILSVVTPGTACSSQEKRRGVVKSAPVCTNNTTPHDRVRTEVVSTFEPSRSTPRPCAAHVSDQTRAGLSVWKKRKIFEGGSIRRQEQPSECWLVLQPTCPQKDTMLGIATESNGADRGGRRPAPNLANARPAYVREQWVVPSAWKHERVRS